MKAPAALTALLVFLLAACGGASPHGRVTDKDHERAWSSSSLHTRYRQVCTSRSSWSGRKMRSRRSCRTVPSGTYRETQHHHECWELELSSGSEVCVSYSRWHRIRVGDRY